MSGGAWADARLAAALLAVDPAGLGGAVLRARTGPAQAAWLALFAQLCPDRPVLRLPPGIADERLLGGLDLAATLAAGRPVTSPGLIAEAAGRVLILPMAERAAAGLVARLGQARDAGAGFTLIALDEGAEPEETAPAALADRLAFLPRLEGVPLSELNGGAPSAEAVAAARGRLARVRTGPGIAASLAGVALALGIASLRAPMLALRAARAAAALAGARDVDAAAATVAARLVLGPRARRLPGVDAEEEPEASPPEASDTEAERGAGERDNRIPDEMLLEAARAAIPPDLVARLLAAEAFRAPAGARSDGAGDDQRSRQRGRPAGTLRGLPRGGARIDLIETLRAAAPWQPLRRGAGAERNGETGGEIGRILVRADDFRVKRAKRRAEKVLIFVVDASGSTALARLAEAKGAIELMLAQTYVARQQVALIAFRGTGAELLLPPTRSLVMTKRRLAGLPGGGGTPLAAGLAEALALARLARARGVAPFLAVLTDGRANIALDGTPGRVQAEADTERIARILRGEALPATVIDMGNRPQPAAKALAGALGASYLPLPRADARALAAALGGALAGAA